MSRFGAQRVGASHPSSSTSLAKCHKGSLLYDEPATTNCHRCGTAAGHANVTMGASMVQKLGDVWRSVTLALAAGVLDRLLQETQGERCELHHVLNAVGEAGVHDLGADHRACDAQRGLASGGTEATAGRPCQA